MNDVAYQCRDCGNAFADFYAYDAHLVIFGKYNQLWRHMLHHRCGQTALEINRFPPPIDLRDLTP